MNNTGFFRQVLVVTGLQLFNTFAFAGMEQLPFPEVQCRDQLLEVLQDWKVTGPWQLQPILTKDQPVYMASTESVGTWVQIQLMPEKTVAATKITSHSQEGYTWQAEASAKQPPALKSRSMTSIDAGACVPRKQTASKEVFAKSQGSVFSDQDLQKLLSENQSGGLILLWSPGMDYSLVAIKNALKAGQDLKMPVQILLDSDADPKQARKSLQAAGLDTSLLQANQSLELYLRGMQNHFPSLQFYQKSQFAKPMLPGLMTAEGYVNYVKGDLQ